MELSKSEQQKKRKEDTRRKILLGAMVLERMERESEYREQVINKLDSYLAKERDRELFEL